MLPDPAYITTLIYRRLQGEVSAQEEAVLQDALASMQHYPEFGKEVLDEDMVLAWYLDEQRFRDEKIQEKVLARIRETVEFKQMRVPVHRVHFLKTAWFRYAAVLLLIAGTATFLYKTYHQSQQDITQQQPTIITPDIQPGGNKAILTLADGSTIVLDSAANGALAQQGNTQIVKLDAGKLAYQGTGVKASVGYNTISTPKGGQYQIVLPDGSRVWLNAASSIRFPTAFGKERSVTITGEVYMEIAADKTRPFFVSANKTNVQVLGTRFNINSYGDEASERITLLEGSVKVTASASQQATMLKAGEEANVSNLVLTLSRVNTEDAVAWKNGFFNFAGTDLKTVMRQLERWYDIEVKYEGNVPNERFGGQLPRSLPLSEVIESLKDVQIRFRLEGRTLTVLQ